MAVLSDVFGLLLGAPATARHAFGRVREHGDGVAAPSLGRRTLLYGAGWAGVIVARSAQADPDAGIVPVGFLDDDRGLKGTRAAGLPIFGDASQMTAARRRTGASTVLITLPHSSGVNIRRVVDAAIRQGLSVRTVPAVTELLDGALEARQARPLRTEDLLRGPATAPSAALRTLVEDHTVMIAGAGGRIGSQLARRLLALKPGRIVLLDEAEHGLSVVAEELQQAHRVARGSTLISTHLLDVTDRGALSELIRRTVPAVVFHAATLPETAAAERSAAEATLVNIAGTRSLVEAAIDGLVERFVLVSPDHVHEHAGVIGLSMRLAEMVVSDAARRTGRPFASVRVGRLAETDRRALEALRSQLEGGYPVRIEAFQPTCRPLAIAEACGLILEAAASAGADSVYRLDRGTPLRAGDITRDRLRLLGRDADSVPITIMGRPSDDEPQRQRGDSTPTSVPGLMRCGLTRLPPVTFEADVDRFLALARSGPDDQLRAELARYVRFFDSTDTPYLDETGHRPVVPVPVVDDVSGRDRLPLERRRPRRPTGGSDTNPVPAPARVRSRDTGVR